MRTTADSFGAALLDWVHGSTTPEIIERDDGVIEIGAGPEEYLARCAEWPLAEQRAMRHVRGRVVDMGCGGGRVALHLQDRGFDVTGADVSELALRAARLQGVTTTWHTSVDDVRRGISGFDTVVLFGNNLGVFGTPERARRILATWARHVAPGTRLLIESTNPYSGGAPVLDREYCRRNRAKGRALGQCRLRVWYDRTPSGWFSWFFASPSELATLMRTTGWRLETVESVAADEPYVAVYVKR